MVFSAEVLHIILVNTGAGIIHALLMFENKSKEF